MANEKIERRLSRRIKKIAKDQNERTSKLLKKLKSKWVKKKEVEEKCNEKLRKDLTKIFKICQQKFDELAAKDIDFYKRLSLALEFKGFMNDYINPSYHEHFIVKIEDILEQALKEEEKANEKKKKSSIELENKVKFPQNCMHIGMAYKIWEDREKLFFSPVELGIQLKVIGKDIKVEKLDQNKSIYNNIADSERDNNSDQQKEITNINKEEIPNREREETKQEPILSQKIV